MLRVRAQVRAAPGPAQTSRRLKASSAIRRHSNIARLLVLAFAIMVLVASLARAGTALVTIYTPGAVAVALCLFYLHPPLYVGFTWWIWFLSPLVRRLVDHQLGFNETNPVLLAPTLVTGLAVLDMVRFAPQFRRKYLVAFLAPLMALGYGYVVGLVEVGGMPASYGLATWGAPLCFGCYLALNWKRYAVYRDMIQRTFLWGLIVLGVYGVIQFINPPEWDRYWMIAADMRSIGNPEPYEVRVFGTLNSPGPFAAVLVAGLLFVSGYRHRLRWLGMTSGALAFLLSLVRAGWSGWMLGTFLQWLYARDRARWHLALGTAVTLAAILALLTYEPFSDRISSRFDTLTELESDNSFLARQDFYRVFFATVAESPLGTGLGTTGMATVLRSGEGVNAFESGWLDVLFSLGWFGGLFFLGGLIWLLRLALPWDHRMQDQFAGACRASTVAFVWMGFFGNVFTGVAGTLLWTSIALCIASTVSHKSAGLTNPHAPAAR